MRVNFQGQVNRLISEGAVFTRMAKGLSNEPNGNMSKGISGASPQMMASQIAKKNSKDEIDAKKVQKIESTATFNKLRALTSDERQEMLRAAGRAL